MENLTEEIKKEIEATKARFEPAKNGKGYTICLENDEQKQYILSKYNPQSNACQLINGKTFNKHTLWIIVGFMFGYHIEEIVKKVGKEAKVIVVEPNIAVLKEQLTHFDKDKFKECGNIYLFAGMAFDEMRDAYEKIIDASNYDNVNTIITPPYRHMYPLYCKEVIKTLSYVIHKEVINQNTSKAIYGQIIKNNILNRHAIAKSYELREQYLKYKDIPAVIVSAGPSLDKNIHHLKEFNGLIFTGGRTLSPVLAQGIKPDFTAVIDSSDIIYDTFKEGLDLGIPLLATPQGCHKVIEANNGPQYFIENSTYITRDLLGVDLQSLCMAGTVATICLASAVFMGCNPIIFIGQDLAYTNMQTHAKVSQIFDGEKENVIKEDITYIPGYYGEDVPSRVDLISFLDWIQGFIKGNPQVTYINATEGGAFIEGTVQKTLKETIAQYNCPEKVSVEHQVRIEESEVEIENHIQDILKQTKEVNKTASLGKRLASELLEELTLYKGKRTQKIQEILSKLEREVDNKAKQYRRHVSLNELFETAYNEVKMSELYQGKLNETQEENKLRIAKLNVELYASLQRSCDMLIKVIEEALEESMEE